MREYTIDRENTGQRLDKFCRRTLSFAPASFIYKMLRKKNIKLNGGKASGNELLREGDAVTFYLSDETFEKFHQGPDTSAPDLSEYERAFSGLSLEILYEDDDVLFACKPPGVLSQKAEPGDVSANEWVTGYAIHRWKAQEGLSDRDCARRLRQFRPSVCNRLDRNTGGILICALSLQGSRVMTQLLRERTMRKFYCMVVRGCVPESGSIGGWLIKDAGSNTVTLYRNRKRGAKEIRTEYRPLRYSEGTDLTLVEAELITGKTHQLRAHMASIGHPILGDDKYGDRALNRKFRVHGQLLFSCRVELPKDTGVLTQLSGKVVTARLPEIFNEVLEGK